MSKQDRKIIFIVLLLALLLALVFYLASGKQASTQAVITLQGEERILPLDHAETLSLTGAYGPLTVEIAPGKIRVAEVTCPDQTCYKTGWIERSGQVIVCIPNQLVIHLEENQNNQGLDAVVY